MHKGLLAALTIGAVAITMISGTAIAKSDDPPRRSAAAAPFEIRIDPELDAKFGPRPVNAVQAAAIVTGQLGGGEVDRVELDEEDGRAVWEVEIDPGSGEMKVSVDAFTGDIVDVDD